MNVCLIRHVRHSRLHERARGGLTEMSELSGAVWHRVSGHPIQRFGHARAAGSGQSHLKKSEHIDPRRRWTKLSTEDHRRQGKQKHACIDAFGANKERKPNMFGCVDHSGGS